MTVLQDLKSNPPQGLLQPQAPVQQAPVQQQQEPAQEAQQAPVQPPQRKRDYSTNPINAKDRDAFDYAIALTKRIIHDKEGRDAILKQLFTDKKDAKKMVPRISASVLKKVSLEMDKAKIPIDPMIKAVTAAKITKEVSEIAEASGAIKGIKPEEMKLMVADTIRQSVKVNNKRDSARRISKAMIANMPEEQKAQGMQALQAFEQTKADPVPQGMLGKGVQQ